MSRRLTVRLSPPLARWVAELGQDSSATARALMVLGAALLSQPEAAREACRALRADFTPELEAALLAVSAGRPPSGGQTADMGRTPAGGLSPAPAADSEGVPEATGQPGAAGAELLAGDFDGVGYDV